MLLCMLCVLVYVQYVSICVMSIALFVASLRALFPCYILWQPD